MCWIDGEWSASMLILAIPAVAVAGWIMAGVVRTISAHRLLEAAVRERIALLAQGVDPSQLPGAGRFGGLGTDAAGYDRYRAQGLLVWGFVLLAGGATLALVGYLLDVWTDPDWTIGVVAASIGLALLAGSAIIWPRGRR